MTPIFIENNINQILLFFFFVFKKRLGVKVQFFLYIFIIYGVTSWSNFETITQSFEHLTSQSELSTGLRTVSLIPRHALVHALIGPVHIRYDQLLSDAAHPYPSPHDSCAERNTVVKPFQSWGWVPTPCAVDGSYSAAVYHLQNSDVLCFFFTKIGNEKS